MNTNSSALSQNRLIHFDIMRLFAAFAVVVIHVSAEIFDLYTINSVEWMVTNFFDSVFRWAVPVFIMISGSLFLSKKIDIKKLYKKNILKIIIAYIVWASVYAIYSYLTKGSLLTTVTTFIEGDYHMWYLFMIVGLYIVTPILKQIIESKNTGKYFCIVCIVFSIILPTVIFPFQYIQTDVYNALREALESVGIAFGYMLYYILGYYLSITDLKKYNKFIYLLGITGFILTFVLTEIFSVHDGKLNSFFYDYFSPTVFAEGVFVYAFIKNITINKTFNPRKIKIIFALSNCSFGIYLVHLLILHIIKENDFIGLSEHAIVAIPVLSLIIFAISFVISFTLNKIPFINKYIV